MVKIIIKALYSVVWSVASHQAFLTFASEPHPKCKSNSEMSTEPLMMHFEHCVTCRYTSAILNFKLWPLLDPSSRACIASLGGGSSSIDYWMFTTECSAHFSMADNVWWLPRVRSYPHLPYTMGFTINVLHLEKALMLAHAERCMSLCSRSSCKCLSGFVSCIIYFCGSHITVHGWAVALKFCTCAHP